MIAGVKENNSPPQDFQLKQNYPNPFNPSTTITYQIPQSYFVSLKVYDTLGNAVAVLVNGEKPKGIYHVTFNATNLASGVYVYQLKAYKKGNMTDDFIKTRKMILLK